LRYALLFFTGKSIIISFGNDNDNAGKIGELKTEAIGIGLKLESNNNIKLRVRIKLSLLRETYVPSGRI
jgi:hypothetical protein